MSDEANSNLNESDLLLTVLELPASEREAYLDHACRGQLDLKERVKALLRNAESDDSFMAAQLIDLDRTIAMSSIEVGGIIGRYRLMEQIGEGGMGVVFVAEQTEPIARKVALKVIKPGMDSKSVISRFEAERQALAMMDHPNIARVLDAGTTPERLPYFVMELVRGLPITKYCDQAKANIHDRLRLFMDVCNAVQHAHQKGIIHRDLKPSNILITLHDGKPVVKVIDFGVAKALHQPLTQHTIYTGLNQILGTPLYMSPEQLELSGLDIDTRSDIYSLGVLLYELISGSLPFERDRLLKSGFDEMRRIIREEDPPRPSNRIVSMHAKELSTVAETRGLDQRELHKTVQKELDWITLKSLAKDRTRRYNSASEFAADIQRFLDDTPVLAHPPSVAYLASKFIRKHRRFILFSTLLACSLILGTVMSIRQAIRATEAEHEVEIKLDELITEQSRTHKALEALQLAEGQQRELRKQAEVAAKQASESAEQEKRLRTQAEKATLEAKWNLYVADLSVMQTALDERNFGRLSTLLRNSTPTDGETDFRDWEWYYFEQCAEAASSKLPSVDNRFSQLKVDFNRVTGELAAFTAPNFIDVWNTNSLTRLKRFDCQQSLNAFKWSPDGKYIAVATESTQECMVMDSSDGTVLWIAQPFERKTNDKAITAIGGLSWSYDSQRFAVGNRFGDIAVANLKDRVITAIYTPSQQDHLADISWHPKDERILVGMRSGKRMLLDTKTGTKKDLSVKCDKVGDASAWSPSGNLISTSEGNDIRIATHLGDDVAILKGHNSSVTDITWIDENRCLSVSKDHSARLWNIETRTELQAWRPTDGPIYSVTVSPSQNLFAIGSNHPVRIINFEPTTIALNQSLDPDKFLYLFHWAPDSSKLYAVGYHDTEGDLVGSGTLLDGMNLRPLNRITSELSRGVGWSPDSRFILQSVQYNQILVGDPRTHLGLQQLDIPLAKPIAVWSPTGQHLMSSGPNSPFTLRNSKTGEVIRDWSTLPHKGMGKGVWSPSETHFLAAGGYPIVLHVDGRSSSFPDPQSWDNSGIAWHPSERILAVGDDKGLICIRDSENLQPLQYLNGHVADIKSLDFSPNGRRLVSASSDRTVRIWDVATGRELIRLKAPNDSTFVQASWSPDGQQLAATTESSVVLFGPSGMSISPVNPAICTHGKVFQYFEQQGIADQFSRKVPVLGWRIQKQKLNKLLLNCDRSNPNELKRALENWLEPCQHSAALLEDYLNAVVQIIDGYKDEPLAIQTGEIINELLGGISGTIEKKRLFYWQNEVRLALVHRTAKTSDPSQLLQVLSEALEFEKTYATEFAMSPFDWYRRLSLETLSADTVVKVYLASIGNADQTLKRNSLIERLAAYKTFLKQVPNGILPLTSPIDAQTIQDRWARKITEAEIHQNSPPTFPQESIEALERTIRRKETDPFDYYQLAITQLVIGNHQAYSATCQKMLNAFAQSSDSSATFIKLWTACLAPSSLPDYETARKLLNDLPEPDHVMKGAVYLRMNQYEIARAELLKAVDSVTDKRPLIEEHYFLALTEARLNNLDNASQILQRADSLFEQTANDPAKNPMIRWDVLATWRLLQAEARKAIEEGENEQF